MSLKIPEHVAIIMDGNGRWARKRGLPRIAGHYKGAEVAEDIVEFAIELGIKHLTLFAFSTENWNRPKGEVEALFELLRRYLQTKKDKLYKLGIRVRFIGRRDRINKELVKLMQEIEEESKKFKNLFLNLAVDYGGRDDILRAVKKAVKLQREEITEELFSSLLDLSCSPDPDLLIRTAGEKRISNFLLWNLAYTELYFSETLWPDFSREEFLKALEDFSRRKRKFGRVLDE
uniref:Isoprenyl transferase n=1 Tax=Aquifex pyrophilus TaxID=2714 RepID=ISPT_AQUPY|nr:RecName: Full=Isoprenyl transferase [Aquifex pyrophilus]AAN12288.1 undecaprenyl pyrophosphate [Aquifex pyrophilus]